MGSPTIYWYPSETGSLEKLDFGEGVTDLQELPSADVDDAYGGDGVGYRSHHATTLRFRVLLERFGKVGTSSIERKFVSLQAHLYKGGLVGFSRDHAKSWAALCASRPSRGDTVLYTNSNGFSAWSASATLVKDDEVVVESVHPDALREVVLMDAPTVSPPVNLPIQSPGVIYEYGASTLARWRDFYPVCWLPKDQVGKPIVTADHRRNWTLDLTLEYLPASVVALYQNGESEYEYNGPNIGMGSTGDAVRGMLANNPPLRDATYTGGFGGSSLDQLVVGQKGSFRLGRG